MIRMSEVAKMAEAMRHREPLDRALAVGLGEQRIAHQLKPAPLQVSARAGAPDRSEGLVQSSICAPEAALHDRAGSNFVQPIRKPEERLAPISNWSAAGAAGEAPARSASSSAAI